MPSVFDDLRYEASPCGTRTCLALTIVIEVIRLGRTSVVNLCGSIRTSRMFFRHLHLTLQVNASKMFITIKCNQLPAGALTYHVGEGMLSKMNKSLVGLAAGVALMRH